MRAGPALLIQAEGACRCGLAVIASNLVFRCLPPFVRIVAVTALCWVIGLAPSNLLSQENYVPSEAPFRFSILAKIMIDRKGRLDGFYYLDEKVDKSGRLKSSTEGYAGNVFSGKYGNAEYLEDLMKAEVIPDDSIKGWGIFTQRTGNSYRLVARKGEQVVDLDNYVSVEIRVLTSSYKNTLTTNFAHGSPAFSTLRGAFRSEGTAIIEFKQQLTSQELDTRPQEKNLLPRFKVYGGMVTSGYEHSWYPSEIDKSELQSVEIRHGVKVRALVGAWLLEDDPEPDKNAGEADLLFSGSASIGREWPTIP